MATVLVTGGTGLIGKAVTEILLKSGYDVMILSRKKAMRKDETGVSYAWWNVEEGTIDGDAIRKADYIIHLAGANIAGGRWTAKRKQEIVESRRESGNLLVKAIKETDNKIKAVISASAIGWYGPDPQVPNPTPFREEDPPHTDFLGATCQQWEAAIEPVVYFKKRLVKFRIGIVLSNSGGAYPQFLKPLKAGLASVLGNGKQVISWVHIKDAARAFLHAIEREDLQGIYNLVAPEPVSNANLIKTMAKCKGGFSVQAHVPSFVLKALLGEMSIEVLKSTTVSNAKLANTGFRFLFPSIEGAVDDLMREAKS